MCVGACVCVGACALCVCVRENKSTIHFSVDRNNCSFS